MPFVPRPRILSRISPWIPRSSRSVATVCRNVCAVTCEGSRAFWRIRVTIFDLPVVVLSPVSPPEKCRLKFVGACGVFSSVGNRKGDVAGESDWRNCCSSRGVNPRTRIFLVFVVSRICFRLRTSCICRWIVMVFFSQSMSSHWRPSSSPSRSQA
jgi:hypothetical protein